MRSPAVLAPPALLDHLALATGAAAASPLVGDLGLCLVVAGLLSIVFVKLRIPAIAALLGAGVVLGPAGLHAIADHASIDAIANLGLTLLLFVIGLEVNPRGLLAGGRTLLVTGLFQVPLTFAAGFAGFLALAVTGWGLLAGTYPALYLAVACSFSSTLLVVKYLREQLKGDTAAGRLSVGLLVFQDVWAIVFLALQPRLDQPSLAPIVTTFVATAIIGAAAIAIARLVLARAFQAVARSPELVVTVALGWCFGVGLLGRELGALGDHLGITGATVSPEMGALIAGAAIATSPYAYEVGSRVVHLRDFFVTLFFVGLGMTIPVPDGAGVLILAAILAVTAVLLRALVFVPLLYATGLDRRNAVAVGAKLAQISEFCLVIAYLGARAGHLDGTLVAAVIFAFVLTALATPTLFAISDRLYLSLRGVMDRVGMRSRGPRAEADFDEPPRIVLLGFHRTASAILAELERGHPELVARTLVVDLNPATHDAIRARGAHVIYGDLGSPELLRHAGVDGAEVIVSTVPDELLKGTSNLALVGQLRELAPRAVIVATATRASQAGPLRAAGADHVFRPANEVAAGVLPAIYAALDGALAAFAEAHDDVHGRIERRVEVID